MSEDRDGLPFPQGDDHGDADDEFASVVFDEEFVRSAPIHEPTAQERLLAAAQARAEADAARARFGGADDEAVDDDPAYDGYGPEFHDGYRYVDADDDEEEDDEGDDEEDVQDRVRARRGSHRRRRRPYEGHSRWQRAIAWLLALIMGMGVVALTFAAVYRGASGGGGRQPSPPPATGRVDNPHPAVPKRVGSTVASVAPIASPPARPLARSADDARSSLAPTQAR